MMWNSTGRNDRLTTPPASNNIATDHFNNNPYSRNNPVNQPPLAKVQQDPWNWNWGWDEDGSGGQGGGTGHEENDSWGAQPQSTLHHHGHQQQLHHQPPQQQYNPNMLLTNNSSEFFENIDLSGSTTNNKLFNLPQPTHQQPQHYLNQHPQPPPPQQFFQPQKQPQVSTNSSYSYFQFADPQQPQSLNSSLVNQFPSATAPVSQSQPTSIPYNTNNTHTAPQYSQQSHPSQPQFTSQTPPNYNQFSSSVPFSQHQPLMGYNTGSPSNIINNNNNIPTSSEVENREIAPPEKTGDKGLNIIQPPPPPSSMSSSTAPTLSSSSVVNSKSSNSVPDNQETVPENEERPPDPDTITSSMSNLRLNNSSSLNTAPVMETTVVTAASHDQQLQQQWNSHSGWENQEVAPRFTVDRDQYLETGHLHPPPPPSQSHPQQSAGISDNDVDADTNDEGEAAPPPGLHRMVTGQGQTVGQERLVVGSPPPPPPSSSVGPPSLSQRPHVPGHSMHQIPDLSTHPSPPPLGQRMIPGQLRDDDLERMVLGSSGNSGSDNIGGSAQQQRDQLQNNPVSQRTVPGGRSNDMQQTSRDRDQQQNDHVSQRTVPGGSSSSSGSASSYTQIQDLQSDERLVLGRTTVDEGDDRLQQTQNTNNTAVHNVAAVTNIWTSVSSNTSHQDSVITTHTSSTYQGDADGASQQPPRPPSNTNSIVGADQSRSNSVVSDPPPGLHRMVLGHPDNSSRGGSASGDETSQSGVPPPGLHRMVLGEQQEQKQPDQQPQQPTLTSQVQSQSQGSNADNEDCDKDRELDSDNEFRIRRKQHHRRDSEEDRDYPSDRERERDRRNPDYWERRYDERSRRHYKDRSHHTSYDHSPEYRSEEELDRDRNDFRDHREHRGSGRSRDTRERDRERERDRRRQSPDYYYREEEYRDDQRRPGRDRRYYEPHHYRDRNMYEEDYYYRENRSSRPSSRSGMEYPRRPGVTSGPRDYLQSRNVHPYYPDQGAYQMHYYQLQQQYYEMRRNDPQAYAAWYEQYMASKYGQQAHHPDDSRTSVHSGRSSANHHRSSNEKVLDESGVSVGSSKINTTGVPGAIDHLGQPIGAKSDTTDLGGVDSASRYTPQLYPRGAHIKGKWSKQGQLVLISPNYPNEGQPPIVEVLQLSFTSLQNETDVLEFLETPGPFIVGVTHKNSVLQYLKKRADQASHNAEKLLYELMQLVIRLNGVVDMTDVADLLMANYNEDPGAEHDVQHQNQQLAQMGDSVCQQDINNSNSSSGASDAQQVTDRFRDLLLQGNKLDALEWAMQNKNWGHAFFLASKMDARSYNNVMLRFANGLPANDPLQTLYQMMSGREPQAATCCADKKWGDWRPHLAMMLSNPSGNPDLDRKSIISLGDSLASKGRLFASHFCYVTAQVEFSAFTDRSAKLVLLGTSHHQPFAQFASCRSIMLTLCYEYAKRLNKKDLTIPALQVYKYLLATRLIENGKLAVASQYLEALALDMVHRPSRQNRPLALLVAELADQIKMADPALAMISDPNDDPDWLNTLKQILDDTNDTNLQTSSMSHGISTSTVSTSAADPAPLVNQVVGGYGQEQMMYYDPNLNTWNQPEPQQLDSMQYNTGYSAGPNNEIADDPYHQQQQQLQLQQQQQVPLQNTVNGQLINADYNSMQTLQNQQQNSAPVSWDPVNNMYNTNSWQDQTQHPQIQTSLPPITSTMSSSAVTQEQQKPSPEKKPNKDENSNRRSTKKNKEQASSGWFGGIWDKFALRPKNQMKLPDDKNPSIVWDEKKGRWVNKDGEEEDEALGVRPPPKASELPGFGNSAPPPVPHPAPVTPSANENTMPVPIPTATSTPSTAPSGLPPPSSNSINKFKMQRGRGMKANYIDVMNPNSTKKLGGPAPGAPPPMMDTMPNVAAPVNNFFIPAPVEGNENAPIDFVSSSGPVSFEASHKPLDQTTEAKYSTPDVPTFYNPNSFTVT